VKTRALADYFVALVESSCADLGVELASPHRSDERGSHISLSHAHGFEIMQALIAQSVIGDFRAPDIMRFGFTPLYTRFEDLWIAVDVLRQVLLDERWREPRFAVRSTVT
jgi:kynureninase